ncbi:hypothetical protein TOPH_09235 [Tolypocladium ophioglossoides CBS 100239]|uniref:Uncharacterized protein n=1 Tax=Tolypocladium ophioglossoides (strain CBS 100239) TaxID=1163406 RepID=A0A0L0MW85_TOLOC|nr:hypothetical protein TOPH_09235 [Tolypocladium ophioglossoides CBS 100239]
MATVTGQQLKDSCSALTDTARFAGQEKQWKVIEPANETRQLCWYLCEGVHFWLPNKTALWDTTDDGELELPAGVGVTIAGAYYICE